MNQQNQEPIPFLLIDGIDLYRICNREVNIGRSNKNDLILSHEHISRSHAKLTMIDNRFLLVDLNSTGGTLVNGRQIVQRLLEPGDVITFAHATKMVFHTDPNFLPKEVRPYNTPVDTGELPDAGTGVLKTR